MTDQIEFCAQCGAKLSLNTKYCPECGNRVPGRNQEAVEAEKEMIRTAIRSRPRWAGYLMLIYGIPLLCMGLYYLIDAQGITDMLWQNSTFVDQMNSLGITMEEFEKYLIYFGSAWIISGASGIISAALCFTRKHYYVALVLCIISAILAVSGFIAMFFGLISFWIILSSKLGFKEYESKMEEELQVIE